MGKRRTQPTYHLMFHMGGWWPDEKDPSAYDDFACQYHEAALAVGRRSVRSNQKSLAIPMFHLLRHAFELKFKALLFALEEIDGKSITPPTTMTHSLAKLVRQLSDVQYHLRPNVLALANFLQDLDPNAEHTRYPDGRENGTLSPSRLLMVRPEATRVLLKLRPEDGFREEISINDILKRAASSEIRAFFGGSLDALRESGDRGEAPM